MQLRVNSRYRSLASHKFSPEEKLFVCESLINLCDDYADFAEELLAYSRLFSQRYSVNIKDILDWITIYSEDSDLSLPLCPIDNIGPTVIVNLIKQIDRSTASSYSLRKCIKEELANIRIRR